ncbi:hypothetical protein EJP82_06600 [Paenibacillus anaericanus]|uniref:Uncharacterized protein n=1 Tax=Paenibacillus anaericanus TaxID=170367 RepID=A0A433YBW6_9BACL|nr:hypothetical protein [Paenibacillus anaericanus]RUT47376.1 hypothetical protein EJP82_06600 [Paenibacillus anaericanus]
MSKKNSLLEVGIATVTSKGLYFANHYYSSQKMIKSQWFAESEKYGEWKIPVFFNIKDPSVLILFDFTQIDYAFQIDPRKELDEELVLAYHLVFNNLKNQFNSIRLPH